MMVMKMIVIDLALNMMIIIMAMKMMFYKQFDKNRHILGQLGVNCVCEDNLQVFL